MRRGWVGASRSHGPPGPLKRGRLVGSERAVTPRFRFGVPPSGGLLLQSQSRLKAGRRTGLPEGGTPNSEVGVWFLSRGRTLNNPNGHQAVPGTTQSNPAAPATRTMPRSAQKKTTSLSISARSHNALARWTESRDRRGWALQSLAAEARISGVTSTRRRDAKSAVADFVIRARAAGFRAPSRDRRAREACVSTQAIREVARGTVCSNRASTSGVPGSWTYRLTMTLVSR